LSYAPARFVGKFTPNEFGRCAPRFRQYIGKPQTKTLPN